ncbi:glycine decarboxylase subunit P [Coemansia sp. RSA 1358]|uniref:Glycine cleavage system P protein n=1 Tax=Coemansia umbellata TaxID=1424467 RepID=A0ABQ8PEM9_9FUNG|nr:glycine dehydrogenase [Coemansia spiralis]KAJ1987568.1 glycine decarboxylase subunit P [Coemansia umbellata]KAJ2619373.1 glycine decarboxylase subunit P [Coemansia sp. RSA 1358]
MLSRSSASKAQAIAKLCAMPHSALATTMLRAALLHTLKPRQSSAAVAAESSASAGASAASSPTAAVSAAQQAFAPLDTFLRRHNGPRQSDVEAMLQALGFKSLDEMVAAAVPNSIRLPEPLQIADGEFPERELLAKLKNIASQNKVYRSFIGTGYTDVVVPNVILRNILENPGWYTQYTPYQPEISQGRLESLLNFQTVVSDLTGLPAANASLLDEGTAAGEALVVCLNSARKKTRNVFFADENCHPQTLAVLRTRAEGFGAEIVVGDYKTFDFASLGDRLAGALVSYPDTYGSICDYKILADTVHGQGGQLVVAADLMSLSVLQPPGEFGADIAIGNTQRFGVPLGYGGPHAAFFATTAANQRRVPGRIIGVSRDAEGNRAYRLALQTREQHIRREKASSNICTAQALLANMAAMYAVYHGPEGIKAIADRIHRFTQVVAASVASAGHTIENTTYFDTLRIRVADTTSAAEVHARAAECQINLRRIDSQTVGITLDEAVVRDELVKLVEIFGGNAAAVDSLATSVSATVSESSAIPAGLVRQGAILSHPIFNRYHSETEMLRYITQLQNKDLSLANAMIPLGSCTMKLNATTELIPITWPEFSQIHPFAPHEQTQGYAKMIKDLEEDLASITGMDATTVQPNSGAQGEYAGLRAIRAYQSSKGEGHRNICLVPDSAHGTNPASAVMAGLKVVIVKCDNKGNLDLVDLEAKAQKHATNLSAVMITYPSTFGVFEDGVLRAIEIVHANGGQVYMDGANMNAQVGLTSPGYMGADVCHLNNHKTLAIPHGGGGPGVGPICVKSHLAPFLPGHPELVNADGTPQSTVGPVSAAPYGSAGVLPVTWSYIKLLGARGMTEVSKTAILNANYMSNRLRDHYSILYTNDKGMCAHEFILDTRVFGKSAGVQAIDIAKRLQDYGFHPPTMSWPVPNTIMIEPTESESKEEMDRFCDALITIREEIREIEEGKQPRDNNILVNAPHSIAKVSAEEWPHPYSRQRAAYPLPSLRERKFWPSVSRVDDAYGDLNLMCSCPPMENYQ